MRQRAITAAVLVPVLLVVLFFGGVVLAAAVAIITVFAAIEAFRLLRSAGHEGFAVLGTVLALFVVLEAAFPDVLGERPAVGRDRHRPGRGRIVHPDRPARRPPGVDGDGFRGALRRDAVVHHPPRPRRSAGPGRRGVPRSGCRTRLGPPPRPRGLVV